ncbi:hypothetical protein DPMN_098893 [Dreissena polymorpha]|uniref:Uncharacterized protein n=1 Tax=Dreissena polymorpha TaxID=45954 RepID=A0A9D4R755_DREPO|nr:hypothetical protein DPMN_098893 [Dreissena polymorpha]
MFQTTDLNLRDECSRQPTSIYVTNAPDYRPPSAGRMFQTTDLHPRDECSRLPTSIYVTNAPDYRPPSS